MYRYLIITAFLFMNGLYLHAQTDSSQTRLALDLGITRGKNIYLWPFIRKTVEPQGKDLQIAFTLFQNKHNYADTQHHSHLLPLYWHDSSTTRTDTRFITLGYPSVYRTYHHFDMALRSKRLLELAPEVSLVEYTRSKDGSYLKNSLLFFLWYKNDRLRQRTYFVTFPLYWYFSTPHRRTNTFFPLYSYGSYNHLQYDYMAITPFYWHFNYGDRGSLTALYPLFYSRKYINGSDISQKTVLFPLYFSYNSNDYNRQVLFPLYWSYRYGNNYTRTLFPVIWTNRTGDYTSLTILPLASIGQADDKSRAHRILTPFIGHIKTPKKTTDWFFPVMIRKQWYNIYRNPQNQENSIDTQTTLRVLLWFVSEKSTKQRSTEQRLFPFYWRYKNPKRDDLVLFPVLWKFDNPQQRAFAFMPFYARGTSKHNTYHYFAITPFYWHKNRTKSYDSGYNNVLFPIWWQKKSWNNDLKDASYNVIFPLWWHFTDPDAQKNSKVLFPFVWSLKSRFYRTTAIMPFYSKGQSPDGNRKHLAITPLFWKFDNNTSFKRFLIPVWWYKKSRLKTSNTVFPLYWSRKETTRNVKVIFPVYLQYHNRIHSQYETNRHVIFPIFWRSRSNTDTNTVIFPLSFSYKNNIRSTYTFFPLYREQHDYKTKSLSRMITPLVWHYHDPNKTVKVLFPLYYRNRNTQYSTLRTGITPLIWHYKSPERTSFTCFPVYFYNRHMIDSATYTSRILFPLYYRKATPYEKTSIIFPFVYRFSNSNYSSFTLFPILSKGKSLKNSDRHFVLTPLFWNIHRHNRHSIHLIPFFSYTATQQQQKQFSILYFLYRQSSTPSEKNISFLWPLCEYRKDSISKAMRLAPLLWYSKAPGQVFHAFLPLYYYRKTEKGKQFNLLWQFYTHSSDTTGSRKNSYLFKTLIVNKYDDKDHEYRFLYKVFSHVKRKGKKELSIFPFYYSQSDSATGSSSRSYLLALYGKFKRPIANTPYFYEEEKILWFIRLRSNYKSLKAKGTIKEQRF